MNHDLDIVYYSIDHTDTEYVEILKETKLKSSADRIAPYYVDAFLAYDFDEYILSSRQINSTDTGALLKKQIKQLVKNKEEFYKILHSELKPEYFCLVSIILAFFKSKIYMDFSDPSDVLHVGGGISGKRPSTAQGTPDYKYDSDVIENFTKKL